MGTLPERSGPPPMEAADRTPVLEIEHVVKHFGGTVVLDDVSLTVESGEVHALVGSNGSGKSTLVKLLTGVYAPTAAGRVRIGGQETTLPLTRSQLRNLGVRVVHQSLALIDDLSVAENVAMGSGFARTRGGAISWRQSNAAVAGTLEQLGLDVHPGERVGDLAAWQRVGVAVARAFHESESARLILLDEVTAAMPREEVSRLFSMIRRLTAHGAGVLYVTHRFEEIFVIADRATVLRDGKIAETRAVEDLTQQQLVDALTGIGHPAHAHDGQRVAPGAGKGKPIVHISDLSARLLRGVNLDVARGEILGVTGRAGCGKSELGRLMFGLQPYDRGSITYDGFSGKVDPRHLVRAGVAYVPQDRRSQALLNGGTTRENLTLTWLSSFGAKWWLDLRTERREAERTLHAYNVKPPNAECVVDTLSGGNQQKLVMSRWLSRDPKIVVLDEPTEGVDIPSRREIYEFIRHCAASGAAVVVLSSSAEEIVELCHRAIVIDEGRVVAALEDEEMDVSVLNRVSAEAASHV